MMKKRREKGMTLIEVVVALVILGIIITAMLNTITSGFVWVFNSGHRTQALAEAQTIVDTIYSDGIVDETVTTSNIYSLVANGTIDGKVASESDLNSSLYNSSFPDKTVFYSVTATTIDAVVYSQLKILVFYQSGKQFVTLTALIP